MKNYTAQYTKDIPIKESGWIAARCFEKSENNVRFAHTAPVFIEVQNKQIVPKRNEVEYFITRAKKLIAEAEDGMTDSLYINHPRKNMFNNIRIQDESERRETLAVYRKALAFFEDMLKRTENKN